MFKELAKSFLIYGVASGIGKFISLFLVPIYTRMFTPDQYGVIDLISTLIALVSILGMAQLESAVARYYYTVKETTERRLYVSTALWTIVTLSIFWVVIVFFLAGYISELLFKTNQYRSIISTALLIIPFSNIFSFLTVVMRFDKKPVIYAAFVTVQLLSTVGISVWLVVFERTGIAGVFYGQLFGFILGAAAPLFYLRRLLVFTWDRQLLKKYFRYSLPLVPAVAGNWLNAYASRFVMLGYLTLADIGLYTVALKIASVFHLIDAAFRMAWLPFMWENFERPDHRDIYKRIMKIVTIGVFLAIVAFSLFGKEALTLVATSDYVKASPLIGMLAFAIGLTIVVQTIGLGAGITKRTEYNTLIYFTGVGMNVGSLLILVPEMGLIAVPLSFLFSTTVTVALTWLNSEKLYYIGFSKSYFIMAYALTLAPVIIAAKYDADIFTKSAVLAALTAIFGAMLIMGKTPVLKMAWFASVRAKKVPQRVA